MFYVKGFLVNVFVILVKYNIFVDVIIILEVSIVLILDKIGLVLIGVEMFF